MDSLSIQSFSTHVPFKRPLVIVHYIVMVIAFLGCHPLLLTQQLRRQKLPIQATFLVLVSVGLVTGYFNPQQGVAVVLTILLGLVFTQTILSIYRTERFAAKVRRWIDLNKSIPKWIDSVLAWLVLVVGLSYLSLAALVFTESCNDLSQCLMPVSMGTGFLMYGTVILLHLLSIVKLPRPSTPEYYEGMVLTFWGFISLCLAGMPIIGSEWRAINLGLLWFTGGLFSISLSVQTWIPALRERNIINALIICLTGRAIVTGFTESNDTFAAKVHTMLGYLLMIGAIARSTQIVFRKSPTENLPHRMLQPNADTTNAIDDDDEDNVDDKLVIADQPKCRHKLIFASITLVTGLLASFMSIGGGILLMGSNVGWMRYMKFYIKDPSTYVNLALAVAFLWSAYVFVLCTVYKRLKIRNAIHQYDYLELSDHHEVATTMTRGESQYHSDDIERRGEFVNSNLSSSPITTHHYPITTSPISTTITPFFEHPLLSSSSTTTENTIHHHHSNSHAAEKTMRPSEYRAKRRSLLLTQPNTNVHVRQERSPSNNYGVGGILPDEFVISPTKQQHPQQQPIDNRRLWRSSIMTTGSSSSSSSSAGFYSGEEEEYNSTSAPTSPKTTDERHYNPERRHSIITHEEQVPASSSYNTRRSAEEEIIVGKSSGTNRGQQQQQKRS
ncbi:MAG: hypothetical protein EXX96DRAFT_569278 [Benjaminiella poitrasii]|nr:MAG: hypothetical protein EXX96DRAFT_569278 [Benjaminiella poitrasii]